VAEPHKEAGGSSQDGATIAWRGEWHRFLSPAGRAGLSQACSVLTLPPTAETGKGACYSAPYYSD